MPARIVVISDSHGDTDALRRVLEQQPTARAIFHLGDGAREMESLAETCSAPVYQVLGNCDSRLLQHPPTQEVVLGGCRIFATHGHLYGVKHDIYRLTCAAREREATLALFGHTHTPFTAYEEGLYLVNPGSVSHRGTYATVDIDRGALLSTIVSL